MFFPYKIYKEKVTYDVLIDIVKLILCYKNDYFYVGRDIQFSANYDSRIIFSICFSDRVYNFNFDKYPLCIEKDLVICLTQYESELLEDKYENIFSRV